MNRNDIEQKWFDYVTEAIPENVTVIFANPEDDAPRPRKPYITLNLIVGPRPLTLDDELRLDGETFELVGQRSYTLSIQGYGQASFDTLSDIQTGFDDPDLRDILREADIAITNKGSITNITRGLSSGYEQRASLDIMFNSSNNKLTSVESIEIVEIDGGIANDNRTIETTQTINKG